MRVAVAILTTLWFQSTLGQTVADVNLFQNIGINVKEPFRDNQAGKLAPHYNWQAGAEVRFNHGKANAFYELLQLSFGHTSLRYVIVDRSLLSVRYGTFRANALVGLATGKRLEPSLGIFYAYQMQPSTVGVSGLNSGVAFVANLDNFEFAQWQSSNAGLIVNVDWKIMSAKQLRLTFTSHASVLPLFREPTSFRLHQGNNASYGYEVPLNLVPMFFSVGLKERIF